MGTLSKRPLSDFGYDIKSRIEDFRSSVGGRIDQLHDDIDVKTRQEPAKPKPSTAAPPTWMWFAIGAAFSAVVLMLARHRAV
jgi:hypothetical protein